MRKMCLCSGKTCDAGSQFRVVFKCVVVVFRALTRSSTNPSRLHNPLSFILSSLRGKLASVKIEPGLRKQDLIVHIGNTQVRNRENGLVVFSQSLAIPNLHSAFSDFKIAIFPCNSTSFHPGGKIYGSPQATTLYPPSSAPATSAFTLYIGKEEVNFEFLNFPARRREEI